MNLYETKHRWIWLKWIFDKYVWRCELYQQTNMCEYVNCTNLRPLITLDKFYDNTLDYATTASFYILSNSFIIL
jgi:hypothetical protein